MFCLFDFVGLGSGLWVVVVTVPLTYFLALESPCYNPWYLFCHSFNHLLPRLYENCKTN